MSDTSGHSRRCLGIYSDWRQCVGLRDHEGPHWLWDTTSLREPLIVWEGPPTTPLNA